MQLIFEKNNSLSVTHSFAQQKIVRDTEILNGFFSDFPPALFCANSNWILYMLEERAHFELTFIQNDCDAITSFSLRKLIHWQTLQDSFHILHLIFCSKNVCMSFAESLTSSVIRLFVVQIDHPFKWSFYNQKMFSSLLNLFLFFSCNFLNHYKNCIQRWNPQSKVKFSRQCKVNAINGALMLKHRTDRFGFSFVAVQIQANLTRHEKNSLSCGSGVILLNSIERC